MAELLPPAVLQKGGELGAVYDFCILLLLLFTYVGMSETGQNVDIFIDWAPLNASDAVDVLLRYVEMCT